MKVRRHTTKKNGIPFLESPFIKAWRVFLFIGGPSPIAPQDPVYQHNMNIDGQAYTSLTKFSSLSDIEYLRFDVTNLVYYLRPHGRAFIIGVGGGRDIQSAILFQQEEITGVDVNPIFIKLLQNEFREFSGIADYPGVTLIVDEARSFLSRTDQQYSIIQMSLIDTWAATGAGAYTLSENALYTVEAWQTVLNRLEDNGIFTVSRWYAPSNVGETGRAVSLAVASLLEFGVKDPSKHIVLVTAEHTSTLLMSKKPFTMKDINNLQQVSKQLQFEVVILPGIIPEHEALRKIVNVKSLEDLNKAIENEPLNYTPSTDEQPYFFNMLKLKNFRLEELQGSDAGVVSGNILATLTLLGLIIILFLYTLVTVVTPLILGTGKQKRAKIYWPGAIYFAFIGAGFMFIEIALLQRLSVFLTHPIYTLGILLFSIIASTGVGSYISGLLPLERAPWVYAFPIATSMAAVFFPSLLTSLLSNMIEAQMIYRIAASIIVIFPLGILLGFFFPLGMQLYKEENEIEIPWYWAINGIFGVLCSAIAVFISIYFSISTNFYIAALFYFILILPIRSKKIDSKKGHVRL